MIILFMDVYKVGSTGRVALVCNFGGFVSFLAGLFGFILAGTDRRRIHMDNFGRQKFNQMDNFVPQTHRQTHRQTDTQTDRHTDRHTDTLLIFISIDSIIEPLCIAPLPHCLLLLSLLTVELLTVYQTQ